MPVFQPAEETAVGAHPMIDDGLFKPFRSRAPYWGSTSWSELPATFADFTGTMKCSMTMPDGTVILPTGKSFHIDFCTVAHWNEQGQIVEENLFYDLMGMLKQIGAMLAQAQKRRKPRAINYG